MIKREEENKRQERDMGMITAQGGQANNEMAVTTGPSL